MLKSVLTFDAISNLEPWIQIDLLSNENIYGIATQGMERYHNTDRWVKMYYVKYGFSGDDLYDVIDENGRTIVS